MDAILKLIAVPAEDGEWALTGAGYTVLIVLILALFLLCCFLFGKRRKIGVRQLAFSGAALALAVVTSEFLPKLHMPMGGSVTLFSMLFVTLIGYWYGPASGLTAAFAYGLLQLVLGPYIISLPQLLVDYPLAFGALGLSGFFWKTKGGLIKGYLAGVLGRYFFAVLSGAIFFGMWAPDTFPNAWVYSLVYNGAYIGLEAAITLILLAVPAVRNAMSAVREQAQR